MKNLSEKQPRLVNRVKPILLHDNARPRTANRTQLKLLELNLETVDHTPYSPDLLPTDYHLFRNLDNFLQEKIFNPNRLSKMPSALSSVLALQASMQKAFEEQ